MASQSTFPTGVIVAHDEKTCLALLSGAGLTLRPPERAKRADHLITVLPANRNFGFVDRLHEIADWVWKPARSGRGRVVFDASMEGHPHDIKRSHVLHRVLDRSGVPRAHAVYLTQDRGYADAYRTAFQGEPLMRVVVYDYWIRTVVGQHFDDGQEVFESRLSAYRKRSRRRERRFLSLNRNLRASKVLFLLRLLRDGLWDHGFVSHGDLQERRAFKGFRQGELEAELFREAAFGALNEELAPLLPRLEALGKTEFTADASDKVGSPVQDQPLGEYGRSWFSVVTETEMRERPLRITEKPFKPLMNFHPFIVLGNPGSLRLLSEYGFHDFGEMFDASYDQEPDPRARFERVFAEVERLCALDETELDRLDEAVAEVVIHNARHALVRLPRIFHDRLDRALVEQILAPAEPAPSPQSDRMAALG